MTLVQIANDLLVHAEQAGPLNYFLAVETSQPVSMLGASIVKVSGVVHAANQTDADEECRMEVQGSNDLIRWVTLHSQTLPIPPNLPSAFESTPAQLAVPFAFVRVRWVVYPTTDPPGPWGDAWYLLSAHLNTGTEAP
jgi:hypothetical protein